MNTPKAALFQYVIQGNQCQVTGPLGELTPEFVQSIKAAPNPIIMNLAGLRGINSIGIKRWTQFIQALAAKNIELHECPVEFVDAANFIPAMIQHGQVRMKIISFQVPLICEHCQKEHSMCIPLYECQAQGKYGFPPRRCPDCGFKCKATIDPEEFFSFTEPT
jgi:hypothetical protein